MLYVVVVVVVVVVPPKPSSFFFAGTAARVKVVPAPYRSVTGFGLVTSCYALLRFVFTTNGKPTRKTPKRKKPEPQKRSRRKRSRSRKVTKDQKGGLELGFMAGILGRRPRPKGGLRGWLLAGHYSLWHPGHWEPRIIFCMIGPPDPPRGFGAGATLSWLGLGRWILPLGT